MADSEKGRSEAAETQTPPPVSGPAKFTSVPENVVEAINKPNDLVPALFALPCERGGKKMKLCKQVAWVKDGVFTTGYMEINIKEATKKGLFNQPRRATVISKEDCKFQSVPLSGNAATGQLKSTMSRRNCPSSTVVIDVKGKLATNLITVQKDTEPAAEIAGRLVPLKQAPAAPTPCPEAPAQTSVHAECSSGSAAQSKPGMPPTSEACPSETDKPKGLGGKGTALSTNKNEREPSTQRNTRQDGTKPSEPGKHPIPEYILTVDGKMYPTVAKPDFPVCLSDRHASRKLQQLVNIADANRKPEVGAVTTPSSSSGRHLTPGEKTDVRANVPASTANPPVPSSAHDKAGKQNLDGSKHDLDVLMPEAPHKGETHSERTETVSSSKSTSGPANAAFNSPILKENRGSPNEQPVTSSNKDRGIVSSESNPAPLTGSKYPLTPLAISCLSPKRLEMPASSSEDSTRTDDKPSAPANVLSSTSGPHSSNCAGERNRALDPLSPASNTSSRHTPTDTLLDADDRDPSNPPALPSLGSSPVRASDSSPSPKESDEERSDGFPGLRIDSVFSLSEKEAEKLFPKPPSKFPDKPSEPPDAGVQSETTSSPLVTNAETKSRFVVTSKTAVSNRDLNIDKFPFSNTSNVQLYNVKPLKAAGPVTTTAETTNKTTLTPATVAPTSAPSPMQKNTFVCIPPTVSNTKVQPQVSLVPPKQLLTFHPSYLKANPTMITLVPVKIGSPGLNTCQATFVSSTSTKSTAKAGEKVTTTVTAALVSGGTKPVQFHNTIPPSTIIPTTVKIPVAVKPSSADLKRDASPLPKSPRKTLVVVSSHDTRPPASRSVTQNVQAVSQTGPNAKSQNAVIKVFPKTTTLPPRKAQVSGTPDAPFIFVPGNKLTFVKGFNRNVTTGSQQALNTSVDAKGGRHGTLPKSSSAISNTVSTTISSPCTSVPIQTVKMTPGPAPSPAASAKSRDVSKAHVAPENSSAKPSDNAGTATPSKLEVSKANPKEKLSSKPPEGEPSQSKPKKTFLVTTSDGQRRLVCLPFDDEAATVLSRMASNKVYQVVAPQNTAEEKKPAENRGMVRKKEHEDRLRLPDATKRKKAKTSHRHDPRERRAKKKMPRLKIKFTKEPRADPISDLRRSVRERKLKRPYSPPGDDVTAVKPARLNSPKGSGEETSNPAGDPDSPAVARSKDTKASGEETTPPGSGPDQPQPGMQTAPTKTHPDPDGAGRSLAFRPPSPQSFLSREDRVRQLKELMKEKEAALEAILKQRRREQMERLADPQLSTFDIEA